MVEVEFVDGTKETLKEESSIYYDRDTQMFKLGTALFPILFPREFVKSIRVIEV